MAFKFFTFKRPSVVEDAFIKEPVATTDPSTPKILVEDVQHIQTNHEPKPNTEKNVATVEVAPTKVQASSQEVEFTEEVKEEQTEEETAVETPDQLLSLKATREDVIAAYKIFLGRLPESMQVVDPRVGAPSSAILVDFLASKEFLGNPAKSQLVLALAKKILEEKENAASSTKKAE